jgi:fatty acid desaturase
LKENVESILGLTRNVGTALEEEIPEETLQELIVQALVRDTAAWFILKGHWILVLVVNIGCFIAPWLATLCALPQHIGLCPSVPDWRQCSRTMKIHPFVQFFYWNMNYHVEHHMYAGVPFYNLPALHEEIKGDCPEPSYGLFNTWRNLIPVIRKQRVEPGFCLEPDRRPS